MTSELEAHRLRTAIHRLPRCNKGFWRWLEGKSPNQVSKKDANKFLLACSLDFQMKWQLAWDNAQRVAEEVLGDPDKLWEAILLVDDTQWNDPDGPCRLHRFAWVQARTRRIANLMVQTLDGDARHIWKSGEAEAAYRALKKLKLGDAITPMTLGGLFDLGFIQGRLDVKPDVHVSRVLGRLAYGIGIKPKEAQELARTIEPSNPWLIDNPIFLLGQTVCKKSDPACSDCPLQEQCAFAHNLK